MSENIEDLSDKLKFIADQPSPTSDNLSQEEGIPSPLEEEEKWPDIDKYTKHLANERFERDTQMRDSLSTWAAIVVSIWLIGVLLLLVGNTTTFKLDNDVLIALLVTTTLNVLGLMYIVLKGLFGPSIKRD